MEELEEEKKQNTKLGTINKECNLFIENLLIAN